MITFKVSPNWQDHHVACRIAQIVGALNVNWNNEPDLVCSLPFKERENRWQLDEENNWWLYKVGDHMFDLHYRYQAKEMLKGLHIFLEWVFKN